MLYDVMLSFAFSGRSNQELGDLFLRLGAIQKGLRLSGYNSIFCSANLEDFFRERCLSSEEIMDYCLRQVRESGIVVAYLDTPRRSDGMKRELELAEQLEKPVYAVVINGVDHQLLFPNYKFSKTFILPDNSLASLEKLVISRK